MSLAAQFADLLNGDQPPEAGWMPIGAFATASQLSQKTLRFYDEQGVLAPSRVDRDTGYRYYQPAQLAQARRIQMLREIGMPIAEIRALNERMPHQAESAMQQLHLYWTHRVARFDLECEAYRKLVELMLGGSSGEPAAVQVCDELGGWVLSVDVEADANTIEAVHGSANASLSDLLKSCGLQRRGRNFTRYWDPLTIDSMARLQIAVPVVAPVDVPPGFQLWRDAPHRYAALRASGNQASYPRILRSIESVVSWLVQHNKVFVGMPMRTIEDGSDAEWAWIIAMPFVEPGTSNPVDAV